MYIVIYPKGSLTERILVVVAAKVYAKFLKMDIKMVWDHTIPYREFFLGDIDIIDIAYLYGKNYVYNPNIDQSVYYNNHNLYNTDDMHMIIESKNEFKHMNMELLEYVKCRKIEYLNMLRNNISGSLLGKLNLIDVPKSPFVCVDGEYNTRIAKMMLDDSVFDECGKEMMDYMKTLLYSKADVLIMTNDEPDMNMVNATKISMIPLISTCYDRYHDTLIKNYVKNYLGFSLVINPDINKIALL